MVCMPRRHHATKAVVFADHPSCVSPCRFTLGYHVMMDALSQTAANATEALVISLPACVPSNAVGDVARAVAQCERLRLFELTLAPGLTVEAITLFRIVDHLTRRPCRVDALTLVFTTKPYPFNHAPWAIRLVCHCFGDDDGPAVLRLGLLDAPTVWGLVDVLGWQDFWSQYRRAGINRRLRVLRLRLVLRGCVPMRLHCILGVRRCILRDGLRTIVHHLRSFPAMRRLGLDLRGSELRHLDVATFGGDVGTARLETLSVDASYTSVSLVGVCALLVACCGTARRLRLCLRGQPYTESQVLEFESSLAAAWVGLEDVSLVCATPPATIARLATQVGGRGFAMRIESDGTYDRAPDAALFWRW